MGGAGRQENILVEYRTGVELEHDNSGEGLYNNVLGDPSYSLLGLPYCFVYTQG